MTKILLVEDDKSLREIYGTRLLAENFDIVSAGDGEEALAMAIKEKPDMIISDVMMPKISGFDMLDILRSTTETRDIKVIMMTALSSDDQRARGEQLGADKYLVKSQVGIEDVVAAVHQVLGDGVTSTAPATPAPAEEAAPAADASVGANPEAASGAAPGNDAAGPLPPQPSELKPLEAPAATDSTLPEPTAPFSSPRPANLGENALQPTDGATSSTPDLSAPASLETPSADSSAPADSTAPATGGLGFDTPNLDASAAPAGEPAPLVGTFPPATPETPSTTPDLTPPSEENKDDSTPPVTPATPAV